MDTTQLISPADTIRALLDKYRAGVSPNQAQLDFLVQRGLLNTRDGAYWTTSRANSFLSALK